MLIQYLPGETLDAPDMAWAPETAKKVLDKRDKMGYIILSKM